ncbi:MULTISPECIES: ABC transporter substrate-binding protein [Haloprofundus]|uniref:ABC transporter substrate-binding protein n=1 Tax=Haloprofundus TaxID=1911573 RepID=UPI000E43B48F|nr:MULTISPECIES: ABC transporter substrate-binding protein [Haloprofundus]QCJ48562.1 twin-arginine translocation signal domain-containing protein [Haloprofundus sp. MHR1]
MSDDSMNGSRRRFLKASGAGAVALTLAGCSDGGNGGDDQGTDGNSSETDDTPEKNTTNPDEITRGGTFTVGMDQQPKGINPLSTSSAYSWSILDFVYCWGTTIDPVNFNVNPSAYTEWTVENASGDDAEPDVYFNVRDGLTFSDGEDLTVEDVIFTYNYLMEKKPGRYVSTVEPIQAVEEADNDWDVHMKLAQPIGTYDSTQLQVPLLPKHVWEEVDDYQAYQPQENGGPIGAGPGEITTYSPDTAIEVTFRDEAPLQNLQWLQDHDNLLAGGPFIDSVRFKIYGSQSALTQAFLNGEIDTVYSSIETSKVEQVEETDGQSIVQGYDTGYGHYSFNLRRTPLDDLAFRQVLGFAFDDIYWTQQLQRGYVQEGDFVMPPGYSAVRPDAGGDGELLTGAASQAFTFRGVDPTSSEVDVEGIRQFLTDGQVVTGEGGTYVGLDYPGSLTDVSAGQSEAKHDYSFGEVESSVLQDADAEQEIRVNGETITSMNDGPLQMLIYPAKDSPKTAQMVERYVSNLRSIGIPIERKVMTFNTMLNAVYAEEDFDIFPMSWSSLSPFGASSLYGLFHSDNADDHSEENEDGETNTDTLLNNPMGYGLFEDATADDLISQCRTEMDTEKRNDLAKQAVEQIYLDFPTMITSYSQVQWPVNSGEWDGFVGNIPGPGDSYLGTNIMQVHQKDN